MIFTIEIWKQMTREAASAEVPIEELLPGHPTPSASRLETRRRSRRNVVWNGLEFWLVLSNFLGLCRWNLCETDRFFVELCFSPNSVSTLRGHQGANAGLQVCGILPINFRMKWLLWKLKLDMRFDGAGSRSVRVRSGLILVCGI